MMSAAASVVTGAVLALVAVIGGLGTIAAPPNSPAKSEQVVIYDAP